tara:strand:+ start:297 stop:419 length:123 start_codon:yes stop_codon:yes gene_type:complete
MIILNKTPKEWKEWASTTSLYYRSEIVWFVFGFIMGAILI